MALGGAAMHLGGFPTPQTGSYASKQVENVKKHLIFHDFFSHVTAHITPVLPCITPNTLVCPPHMSLACIYGAGFEGISL